MPINTKKWICQTSGVWFKTEPDGTTYNLIRYLDAADPGWYLVSGAMAYDLFMGNHLWDAKKNADAYLAEN